jgi:hypothetical protein
MDDWGDSAADAQRPPNAIRGERPSFLNLNPTAIPGLLTTVGDDAIIIGVGDMVLRNDLIERVQYIAEQVEKHTLSPE